MRRNINTPPCRFFHTYKDWERESKAAAHPRLRKLLPPVSLVAENLDEATGILEAPNGYKFPSFIVMERGCSLADWQQRQPLSIAAAISMVYEIATLLTTLHRVGRAHRDVQPDNILLMVQTQAWKLSDFAVAGTIGACSPATSFAPCLLPPLRARLCSRSNG